MFKISYLTGLLKNLALTTIMIKDNKVGSKSSNKIIKNLVKSNNLSNLFKLL